MARHCCNPACRREINQAFGMTNAGDYNDFLEGKKKVEDVRELCGRCALPTSVMESTIEIENYLTAVGFGRKPTEQDASTTS